MREGCSMTTTLARPAGIASGLPNLGAYFACLAAYNNGRLHGAWVDLEEIDSIEELQECISWILATSPEPFAEEWAMHEHSGLPNCLSRSEWPDLEALASYGSELAAISGDPEEVAEAYRLLCDDLGEVVSASDFEERYCGRHDSGEDFAAELAEETGSIPEGAAWPLTCIDWEQAWRELEISGDYRADRASSGGVFIFRDC